jgi:hypothetical protein
MITSRIYKLLPRDPWGANAELFSGTTLPIKEIIKIHGLKPLYHFKYWKEIFIGGQRFEFPRGAKHLLAEDSNFMYLIVSQKRR